MDDKVRQCDLSLKKEKKREKRKFWVEMITRKMKVRPTNQVVVIHIPPLKDGQERTGELLRKCSTRIG